MKNRDLSILKAILLSEMEYSKCNECGGSMYEGMCTECGYMEEVSYNDSGLKKPRLADLNKDKDISSYEKKRGAAIEKNMEENHEGHDHEVSMAHNSLDSILWAANELKKHLGNQERDIPAWIQDHITNAENYIVQAAKNFHDYGVKEVPQEEPAANDTSLASLMEAKNYRKYEKDNLNEISVDKDGKLVIKQQYNAVSDYEKDAKIGDYIWIVDNIDDFKYAAKHRLYKVVGKDDEGNLILSIFSRSKKFKMSPESENLIGKKLVVVKEGVKKVGSKYVVYSKKGKKLGSHSSRKKANKQMAAIEISKQGR